MATESGVTPREAAARTYRGRTLEELLPQIRAELGPDAVILCEREGFVGGVGGFFAQRFIEVEALATGLEPGGDGVALEHKGTPSAPARRAGSLDIYVDEHVFPTLAGGEPSLDITTRRQAAAEPNSSRSSAPGPSEPSPFARPQPPGEGSRSNPWEPVAPPETAAHAETDRALERVRAESEQLPDVEDPADQGAVVDADVSGVAGAEIPGDAERSVAVEPAAAAESTDEPLSLPMAAPSQSANLAPDRAAPIDAPDAGGVAPTSNPPLRHRPLSLRVGLPTEPTATPRPVPTPPPGVIAPVEFRPHRGGRMRGFLFRLFGGRFGGVMLPKPSPPRPLDAAVAGELTAALTARGASASWTEALIATAGAHGTALAEGLRAATEAEIARRILPAAPLPATGAAVAFIGAGGAGKTRCTAALASAYSRASTLGVTVVAIDNPHGARELKRLLHADGVPVLSLSGERAERAVAIARQNGFVVVDTPTTTPTDPVAVGGLGARLAPLRLDATVVALPATLGAEAARRALAAFGPLHPSAVAITHADETEQLAVVVEVAIAHPIPLAYLHDGTDHRTALSAVTASALARRLLAA